MFKRFINWCFDGYRSAIAEDEKHRKFLEDKIIKALKKKDWDKAAILQQIMDDRFRR